MKNVKKVPGSSKQEVVPVAVPVVEEAVAAAVEPIVPVIPSTTPSDEISVDDFLGLG